MRGDTAQASCRVAQIAQETKEEVENLAGWTKQKVQDGLGLSVNDSAGASGVGQQIADKTRKGKEKAYQTVNDATQKASEKVQKAEEVIYESAKEAVGKAQDQAQWASRKALEITDKVQVHIQAEAQEIKEEGAQAQVQGQMTDGDRDEGNSTKAAANTTMEDEEDGAQTQAQDQVQAQTQENLTWAKGGSNAAREKAGDTLSNARKKIGFAGTSHDGEL